MTERWVVATAAEVDADTKASPLDSHNGLPHNAYICTPSPSRATATGVPWKLY